MLKILLSTLILFHVGQALHHTDSLGTDPQWHTHAPNRSHDPETNMLTDKGTVMLKHTCVQFLQLCFSQSRNTALWIWEHFSAHLLGQSHLMKTRGKPSDVSRSFCCKQMPQKLHHSLLSSVSWWIKKKKDGTGCLSFGKVIFFFLLSA